MLSGVCLGSNDLPRAGQFYDRVLRIIGMLRVAENDIEIGYAKSIGFSGGEVGATQHTEQANFWILKPYDKQPASHGNGSQVMFAADNEHQVRQFHAAVLALGGVDEGAPGPRDYHVGYYGAYCRDLDGNKLHVFYINE